MSSTQRPEQHSEFDEQAAVKGLHEATQKPAMQRLLAHCPFEVQPGVPFGQRPQSELQLKQVSPSGKTTQKSSPQVPSHRPAVQTPLLHSCENRHGEPGFSVPEAKQTPRRQKSLAQSASALQPGVPFGHAPQSAWQLSSKQVSPFGTSVQTRSPHEPAQKPAMQLPLVQARPVVQGEPGPTELAATQIGKLQTPLAQSPFASQVEPFGCGSMHCPRTLHTPVSQSASRMQPGLQKPVTTSQLPLEQSPGSSQREPFASRWHAPCRHAPSAQSRSIRQASP
jgi:hypothetical protein